MQKPFVWAIVFLCVAFYLTVPIFASDTETTSSQGITVVFTQGREIKTGRYLPPEGERKAQLTDVQKRFQTPNSREGKIKWLLPLAGGNQVFSGYEKGGILWADFQTGRSHVFKNAAYVTVSENELYFAFAEKETDRKTSSTITVRNAIQPFDLVMTLRAKNDSSFFFSGNDLYVETYGPDGQVEKKTSLYTCDPVSRTTKRIASDCALVGWSKNGERVILLCPTENSESFEDRLVILDTRPQTNVYEEIGHNLSNLMLSPDGRFLAAESHMSRPLTGHRLIDLKTKEPVPADFKIKGYAPFQVVEWSPDSHWMLMRYRVPDPDNTGSWIREDAYLVSMDGQNKIKIATDLDPAVCEFLPIPVEKPENEEKKEKAKDSGTDCPLLFRNGEGELCAFIVVKDSDGCHGWDVPLGEEVDVFSIVPPSSPSNRRN